MDCPHCGANELGVLSVDGDHLTRRCRACLRPSGAEPRIIEPLPPVKKAVLYVDQFAVSNFVYIDQPELDPPRTERAERWRQTYERITALVGAQALVCPESGFHKDESLARLHDAAFMSAFDRLQLLLSAGVGLPDATSIEIAQLRAAAGLAGEAGISPRDPRLLPELRFTSHPDRWASRFTVGVATSSFYAGIADEVRGGLAGQGTAVQEVFESWRALTPEQVADQFALELAAYGPSILRAALDAFHRAATGVDPLAVMNRSVQRLRAVASFFEPQSGTTDGYEEATQFFLGEGITLVPKARIGAAMYAVLARQAASGMKAVEPSFATDIAIVSSIGPYCDAILVDGRCAEVLRQPPARQELAGWDCAVLSARDLGGVTAWLDSLAATVTPAHLHAVERAYGAGPIAAFKRAFGSA